MSQSTEITRLRRELNRCEIRRAELQVHASAQAAEIESKRSALHAIAVSLDAAYNDGLRHDGLETAFELIEREIG